MQQSTVKKNLSIRLDPELRRELEFIAGRELRTLANQITVFLTHGVNEYLRDEQNSSAYRNYVASENAELS